MGERCLDSMVQGSFNSRYLFGLKEGQTKWHSSVQIILLFFILLCKFWTHIATATKRKMVYPCSQGVNLSAHWIPFYLSRAKWDWSDSLLNDLAYTSISQASGKHCVASCVMQLMNPTHGQLLVVTTGDCKASWELRTIPQNLFTWHFRGPWCM